MHKPAKVGVSCYDWPNQVGGKMLNSVLKQSVYSLVLVFFLLGPAPVLADQHGTDAEASETSSNSQCTADLRRLQSGLQAIQEDLQRDGVTQQTFDRLSVWRESFRDAVEENSLSDELGSAALRMGGGAAAAAFAGGPVTWGTAGIALTGVIITGFLEESYNTVLVINSWAHVDANTAFYQYLLDYLEFGRVGEIDDPALQRFLSDHGAQLALLTGVAVPNNPQTRHLYLQHNAEALMLFFGYFEENVGADMFPRWKFPDSPGRYGPSRLSAGYYRVLLAGRLSDQLSNLDAEISRLEQLGCAGQALSAIQACGTRGPAAGVTQECTCDLSIPARVWGTDLYTDDSDICSAAIHAGLLRPIMRGDGTYGYGGTVTVQGQQGCPTYQSSTAYGVTSFDYPYWPRSYYFPSVQSGYCDPSSRPPQGQWYCPHRIGSQTDLSCYCAPSAFDDGRVWGTTFYTDDSAICAAARHSGAVGPRGGMIRVIELGPLDEYVESDSNGISSYEYGEWGRSIGFP